MSVNGLITENIIYFSKIDFEKCFMANRTKQPEGCIGISEKCVFAWKSLSSRYREQLKWVFLI